MEALEEGDALDEGAGLPEKHVQWPSSSRERLLFPCFWVVYRRA